MKLLSILTITVALGGCALAQNPVGPSVDTPTRRVEVDVVGVENAPAPTAPLPASSDDPGSAEFEACLAAGGTLEECANPAPPAPNPTIAPEADTVEGGAPAESTAGTPYFGE